MTADELRMIANQAGEAEQARRRALRRSMILASASRAIRAAEEIAKRAAEDGKFEAVVWEHEECEGAQMPLEDAAEVRDHVFDHFQKLGFAVDKVGPVHDPHRRSYDVVLFRLVASWRQA